MLAASLYWPAPQLEQAVQVVEAGSLDFPASHDEQNAEAVPLYVPEAQSEQDAEAVLLYWPAAQSWHVAAAEYSLYLPELQSEQLIDPDSLYLPAGQEVAQLEPVKPALQEVQVQDPMYPPAVPPLMQ